MTTPAGRPDATGAVLPAASHNHPTRHREDHMTTQPLATDCGTCRHTLNWHNTHCQVPDCPCAKFTEPKPADSTTPVGGGAR